MIVLTVVTAPRPVGKAYAPRRVDGLGKGLPNLYLGTELSRGSVRAVARTGPAWVKIFGSPTTGSPPRYRSDSRYSLDRMREATIKKRVPVGSPIRQFVALLESIATLEARMESPLTRQRANNSSSKSKVRGRFRSRQWRSQPGVRGTQGLLSYNFLD
jgi:hypothetical protein